MNIEYSVTFLVLCLLWCRRDRSWKVDGDKQFVPDWPLFQKSHS